MQGVKMRDRKMRQHNAGREIAGLKNAGKSMERRKVHKLLMNESTKAQITDGVGYA